VKRYLSKVTGSSGKQRAVLLAWLAALGGAILVSACGGTDIPTTGTRITSLSSKPANFDDVEIDQATHRLYAADRTDSGVDVFDVSGPAARYLKTIVLPAAPNGLALAPDLGRLYAGTTAGTVEVVDTTAGTVTAEVKTGASEVDLMDYAAAPQQLFAATGVDGTLLTIDAKTNKIVSTAKVGKPVEQPRYNPADGLVYVAVPELDGLARVDPKSGTITKTLPLGGCIPKGLAIKPSSHTAVLACRTTVMAYDLQTGHSQAFGRVADGDIVQYYPSVDRFFVTAAYEKVPTIVGMFGGDPVAYLSSVNIWGGGNAAVYDQANDLIYTTDPRQGTAGVTSFHIDGSRPVPLLQSLLLTVGPFVILAALVAPLLYFLGRSADPIHRKVRVPKAAATVVLAVPAPETTDWPSLGR
jgi:hypothetical protein